MKSEPYIIASVDLASRYTLTTTRNTESATLKEGIPCGCGATAHLAGQTGKTGANTGANTSSDAAYTRIAAFRSRELTLLKACPTRWALEAHFL